MKPKGCFVTVLLLLSSAIKTVVVANHNNTNNNRCPEGDLACNISFENNNNNNNNTGNEDLQIVALHTSQPVPKPQALNMMMAEDQDDSNFRPTALPLTTLPVTNSSLSKNTTSVPSSTSSLLPEEPRGRALNFTLHDTHNTNNNLANTSKHDEFDLSDVTIGDDEDMYEMIVPRILVPHKVEEKTEKNIPKGVCEKGGLTYENGEKLEIGCDSICTCLNGKMDCEERCSRPFLRKGNPIDDPLCAEKATEDPCCAIMVCAGDTETEPLEMCRSGNKTYNRGDTFNKDCSEVCICKAAGKISCKARCPQSTKTSDSCVEIPDPNDTCCKKVLCDVTLDDHQDHEKEEISKPTNKHKILSAIQANSSVILLDIEPKHEDDDPNLPIVEVSNDKEDWNYYQLFPKGELFVKEHFKYVRLENTEETIEVKQIKDIKEQNRVSKDTIKKEPNKTEFLIKEDAKSCTYKGKIFKINEEYNDGCKSLCKCHSNGEMICLKLECPTYFGVDVLDPACVEWETIPPNFEPSAPNCCPEQITCKNNGSCLHEGKSYKNWEQLPINVTGCEKRCYCELGKVECQNTCAPVPALPPPNLPCPSKEASLQHAPDDDCCMYWMCSDSKSEAAALPTPTTNKTTKPDKKGPNNFISGPFLHTKAPSKVLGPLSVYANEDSINNDVNSLDRPHMPHISPEENPYIRNNINTSTNFLGLLPGLAKKTSATKPKISLQPTKHRISIHGQEDNPEDLLQFLQQHPEISNLPSGSVLEIHNLPSNINNDINSNLNPIHKSPYVPILMHPEQTGQDVSLQQILDELHKNIALQGHQHPLIPFPYSPPSVAQRDQDTSGSKTTNKTANVKPHKLQDAFNNHYPDDFSFNQPRDDITVHMLEAVDPHTIRLAFMVPPVIVGLHGRVEVRYTYKNTEDVSSWDLQVFAPPNDLIATPSLEFDLLDLVADKEYKIKITITLRDLHNTPSSKIYKIKTPKDVETTTLPPQIPIEPDLEISDINATWVTIVWKKFTENQLQFIDGVQLRFREIDGKIYTATPLIHRAVTTYTIENLKPNTKYEIGIFFIPFPGQRTELHAEHMIQFTTANLVDTYGFSVLLDVSQIKSTSVEISWSGVPYPEDKYVNIYRAMYQSDSGKEDQSAFKIAKRDSPTRTIITDLKPGTRYRLWLEIYLTNGKIKTSNVQDFVTKPRAAPALGSSSQDKVSKAEFIDSQRGDYYGPLVIVAILAAIAILSTLILLLILVRRHNQNKAAITPPSTRISQSAYDNPTYKVEIQQETMGL